MPLDRHRYGSEGWDSIAAVARASAADLADRVVTQPLPGFPDTAGGDGTRHP
jgi:hypothetical protein